MNSRSLILEDRAFWEQLEYEASHWLASSAELALRQFYLDGFLPETITNTRYGIDVEGTAWVGWPKMQESFRFVTSLPQRMVHRTDHSYFIEDVSLDEKNKTVRIRIAINRL